MSPSTIRRFKHKVYEFVGELTFSNHLINTLCQMGLQEALEVVKGTMSYADTCTSYAWFQSKLLHVCFNITDKDRHVR
jgi:hypothetical protein